MLGVGNLPAKKQQTARGGVGVARLTFNRKTNKCDVANHVKKIRNKDTVVAERNPQESGNPIEVVLHRGGNMNFETFLARKNTRQNFHKNMK